MILLTLLLAIAQPDEKLHNQCLYPTVMVVDEKEGSSGTGFIVRSIKTKKKYRNTLITAYHVIESDGPFQVICTKYKNWSEIDKEAKFPIYVCNINQKNDLAIAVFESDEAMPTCQLDFDHKLFINTKVCRVGFGMMDDARIDFGAITQPKTLRPESFAETIRTNVYSVYGDSGGPLFYNYKVIGVCRAVRNHKDQLMNKQSYFTDIKKFIEWDNEVDNSLSPLYTNDKPLPVLPYAKLNLQNYKYSLPD
jgi:S1-C subfamily serine protease